ncbi:hypothetical protein F2Q69_00059630 [Brassica cretica]|uniref:Uncharacterized protein n=1 Tax=Brassica cretica TaxID=69181 RepID=A0A8S9RRC2_BRACR|nr:hypothetical protein F2Q69_00059630 [Brassica cretica]
MEIPFLLRGELCEVFFAGDAVKVRFFVLSAATDFFTGFCCSLLPAGLRTDRNSRSEESTECTIGSTRSQKRCLEIRRGKLATFSLDETTLDSAFRRRERTLPTIHEDLELGIHGCLSSVIFLLSELEKFDPVRRKALLPLGVEAILNEDDSHEDDISEEYDAFMEIPFLLRGELCDVFFAGDAVKVRFFVLSAETDFFTGFCCSLLPAGLRTDRNSRSEESTECTIGSTRSQKVLLVQRVHRSRVPWTNVKANTKAKPITLPFNETLTLGFSTCHFLMRRPLLIAGCSHDARNRSVISVIVPRSPDLRTFLARRLRPTISRISTQDLYTVYGVDCAVVLDLASASESLETVRGGYCGAYLSFFQSCGLTFPIPEPVLEILAELGLSFTQILPNFLRHLIALLVRAREEGLSFGLSEFRHLVLVKRNMQSPETFLVSPRPGRHVIEDVPYCDKKWREQFLVFKVDRASMGDFNFSRLPRNWAENIVHSGSSLMPDEIRSLIGVLRRDRSNWSSFDQSRIRAAFAMPEGTNRPQPVIGSYEDEAERSQEVIATSSIQAHSLD